MANQITQAGGFIQTNAQFGGVFILPFPPFTISAAATAPEALGSISLPANVKVLALSASASGAAGNGPLLLNACSGLVGTGTIASGTVTIAGTATAAGTINVIVTAPNPGFAQTIAVPVPNGTAAAAAATLVANAINANPTQIAAATPTTGAITIYQLNSQSFLNTFQSPQSYYGTSTATGLTVTPTTPTAFPSVAGFAVGTPDNYYTSTPTSVFAGPGQYLFGAMRPVPIPTTAGNNTVVYSKLTAAGQTAFGVPPFSLAEFDIVFPITRVLTLVGMMPNETGAVPVEASALVRAVVLNPTNPMPSHGPWVPDNSTIGAPSTA